MGESDCQNIREKLDLYLDNELLVETNQSVVNHLGFCANCAAESERRIELRRLLKTALTDKDGHELDREDFSRRRIERALEQERKPQRKTKIVWAALAASLIVVLGLTYWRISHPSKPVNRSANNMAVSVPSVVIADLDRDDVANHQICALSYPPDWTFDQQRVARSLTPGFAPIINSIGRNHAAYKLIEGHICSYQQRQYTHLIFRGNGHTVSVFIEADDASGDRRPSQPRKIDQTNYAAYQVARVDTGHHRISVVSDLSSVENLALANQLVPATLRFVQKLEGGAG